MQKNKKSGFLLKLRTALLGRALNCQKMPLHRVIANEELAKAHQGQIPSGNLLCSSSESVSVYVNSTKADGRFGVDPVLVHLAGRSNHEIAFTHQVRTTPISKIAGP